MAEVVGTVFVRVRAITAGLAGEIKDAVDKGAAEADTDSAWQGFSKNFASSMRKHLPGEISPALEDTVEKSVTKVDTDKHGRSLGSRLSHSLRSAFVDAWDRDKGSITQSIGDFFQKFKLPIGKIPLIAWGAILGAPLIGGAVKVIGDYIIGLIAQLGYLAAAAGAAGAVMGAAFGGLVLAIAPLFLMLKAKTPTLDEFKKKATEITKPWKDLAETIQGIFFPALLDSLDTLNKLNPVMRVFTTQTAGIAAEFVKSAANILTADENAGHLNTILHMSVEVFRDFKDLALAALNGLLPLFSALSPLAELFSDALRKSVEHWSGVIRASSESGALLDMFTQWYAKAALIWQALQDIAVGIKNIFMIGAETADPFFANFADFAQRFREFTQSKEGADRIYNMFQNALPVVQAVNRLLRDIIIAIAAPVITGDTKSVVGFLEFLRLNVLPLLEDVAKQLGGKLKQPLMDLAEALVKVFTGDTLSKSISLIADLTNILATLMAIPGFGQFISDLASIALAFSIINHVLGPFLKVLGLLATYLLGLMGYGSILEALEVALVTLAGVLGLPIWATAAIIIGTIIALYLAFKNWDKIKEILAAFWDILKSFFGWVKDNWVLVLEILTGTVFIAKFIENWDKIKNFLMGLPAKILGWITGAASALWGWIQEAVPKALEALGSFAASIGEWLSGLAGRLGGAFVDAAVALGSWILDAVPTLLHNLGEWLGALLRWLGDLAGKVGSGLLDAGKALIGWVHDAIAGVVNNLATWGTTILLWLVFWPFKLAQALAPAVIALFTWIIDAAPGVASALAGFATQVFNWVAGFVVSIPVWLAGAVVALWNWIATAIPQAAAWLANLGAAVFNWVMNLVTSLPGWIAGAISGLFNWIVEAVPQAINWLGNFEREVFSKVWGFVSGLPGQIAGAIGGMLGWAIDAAAQIGGKLADFAGKVSGWVFGFVAGLPGEFVGIFSSMISVGEDIIKGIMQGLGNFAGKIKDWVLEQAGDAKDAVLGFFGIGSPSKLFMGIGEEIMRGWVIGLESGGPAVAQAITTTASDAVAAARGAFPISGVGISGVARPAITRQGTQAVIHIQEASFTDPVDLDLLVGKMNSAVLARGL